ncbi:hypothetical protein QM646_03710 [Rhodococcus erythropolis]|nr:hypothetical protein [Rhodococcus erythropolis]
MNVVEDIMVMGSEQPLRSLTRDEHLLLSPPQKSALPIKVGSEHALLTVAHFSQDYQAQPFAPPRGLYENDEVRVEWQTMDNRQPFYHRNCDVDEISYQIAGERTLMTELGVIEHRTGEFSRIPRGVAHDNYGRKESHLLFYLPAPATELAPSLGESSVVLPPFPGWEPSTINEAITQCMGARGHDIAVFPVDERELLHRVHDETDRIQILRGTAQQGTTWLYSAPQLRLGEVTLDADNYPRRYRRTLDADEIQYQAHGRRSVITQRGIVELEPGDFLRVPLGVAHTSVCHEPSRHITLVSHRELPQVAEISRTADPYSPDRLATACSEEPK